MWLEKGKSSVEGEMLLSNVFYFGSRIKSVRVAELLQK